MRIAERRLPNARVIDARGVRISDVRGFTLVEALVAVAILAIVALIAWRATAAMTDSEARLAAESARWRQLDALLTRMEADLREAIPRPVRHGNRVEPACPADAAGNSELAFTRAGPDAIDEPGSGGQRVGYRLRNGRIEVLYWPRLDNLATKDPATYALVDGIARFRIEAAGVDARFTDHWPPPGVTDLPRGVRIDLELADGGVIERVLALQ